MMKLPEQVLTALDTLNRNGYDAYIVGGCVRDFLLGRIPADFDITTPALPDEICACFPDYTRIEIGKQHGTIAVIIGGMQIEITTYRIDGEYLDSRHPQSVSYTSCLRDDISRRDFTINAMAYNPANGLIDYFEGEKSLERKEIKCVGEPAQRFSEDALRIMRAIRFSSQLCFKTEAATDAQIRLLKDTLLNISAERIRTELDKLLCGADVFRVLMEYHDIIYVFIPELAASFGFDQHSVYHKYTVWEHTALAVSNIPDDKILRLAMLLHDVGKPACFKLDSEGHGHFKKHAEVGTQMSEIILKRLKYDNSTISVVCALIKNHDFKFSGRLSVKRLLAKMGERDFFRLLEIQRADASSKHGFCMKKLNDLEEVQRLAEEIINESACLSLAGLEINGNDIISLGGSGKEIGMVLNSLLDEVIDERLENKHDALITQAQKLLNEFN